MMEMDVETVVREPVSPHALRASALRQARWLMAFYGITPEELVARVPAQMAAVDSGVPRALPVKYRHPVTGDTWDGVGSHPQWLRRALLHPPLAERLTGMSQAFGFTTVIRTEEPSGTVCIMSAPVFSPTIKLISTTAVVTAAVSVVSNATVVSVEDEDEHPASSANVADIPISNFFMIQTQIQGRGRSTSEHTVHQHCAPSRHTFHHDQRSQK